MPRAIKSILNHTWHRVSFQTQRVTVFVRGLANTQWGHSEEDLRNEWVNLPVLWSLSLLLPVSLYFPDKRQGSRQLVELWVRVTERHQEWRQEVQELQASLSSMSPCLKNQTNKKGNELMLEVVWLVNSTRRLTGALWEFSRQRGVHSWAACPCAAVWGNPPAGLPFPGDSPNFPSTSQCTRDQELHSGKGKWEPRERV